MHSHEKLIKEIPVKPSAVVAHHRNLLESARALPLTPLAYEEADLTLSSEECCFVKEPSKVVSASPRRLVFTIMESYVFMLSLALYSTRNTISRMHHSYYMLGWASFTVYSLGYLQRIT